MRIAVVISEWEQACCGDPFAIGDEVTWQLVASDPALARDGDLPRFEEEHHGETPEDVPHLPVTGRVLRIDAIRYAHVPVVGERRSFTVDTTRSTATPLEAVGHGDGSADAYRVELEVADPRTLPRHVASTRDAERTAQDAAATARDRDRQRDDTGRLLEELADEAVERFGAVVTITRDPARGAITLEPHAQGATAVRWTRSTWDDDGISANVGEGHWWMLPASADGVATVRGLLEAAAAGRVREDVVPLRGKDHRLDTVAWDDAGQVWTASEALRPVMLGGDTFAVAGTGWDRVQRGAFSYAAWL